MKPVTYFDIFGQLVSKHPCGVLKLEMRAHASLAAGCFWQVHDFGPSYNLAVPANGAVPLKVWPAYAGALDYKEFKNGELNLVNGLYVCMSTTEATKTLGTGNNKFAMLAVEQQMPTLLGLEDAESGTGAELSVWVEGDGPLRLLTVKATNLEAGARYLQLFAHDNPANGAVPLRRWRLAATGDTNGEDSTVLRFGKGLLVEQVVAGVLKQGCTLVLSSTAATLTKAVGSGMNCYADFTAQ